MKPRTLATRAFCATGMPTARGECLGLDEERSKLYFDLVLVSLSEAARRELQTMDPAKYEYQSEFARRYVAQGRAEGRLEGRTEGRDEGRVQGRLEGRDEGRVEGRVEGRAALVIRQLTVRFGPLNAESQARVQSASIAELDAIGERLLTAQTLPEALGPPQP